MQPALVLYCWSISDSDTNRSVSACIEAILGCDSVDSLLAIMLSQAFPLRDLLKAEIIRTVTRNPKYAPTPSRTITLLPFLGL
jgi:hypothetical protein